MFLYIIICLLILYIVSPIKLENFSNDDGNGEILQPLNTYYNRYFIQSQDLKPDSANMTFLNTVNTQYKNIIQSLSYEQLSDKKLLDKIKKDVFYNAYKQIDQIISLNDNKSSKLNNCQFLATKICKLPYIPISQTSFPAHYLINTYKNENTISQLDEVNLKCYNEMYNCCKQSYKTS
jgi:hypothetical protein